MNPLVVQRRIRATHALAAQALVFYDIFFTGRARRGMPIHVTKYHIAGESES